MSKQTGDSPNKGGYQNLSIMEAVRKAASAKTSDAMPVEERLRLIQEHQSFIELSGSLTK